MQQASHMLLAMLSCILLPCVAASAQSPFAGRWDLTITTQQGSYPSWMEYADQAALGIAVWCVNGFKVAWFGSVRLERKTGGGQDAERQQGNL